MDRNLRVLVVDDEPTVTRSCLRILSRDGFDVSTTESGLQGLNWACAQDFDLVITDLRMPDLDGLELVRSLRRERPETAILVITGYGTIDSAVETMKLGVSDYLEKPFTPEEIRIAVAKALDVECSSTISSPSTVDTGLVKDVLRQASRNPRFGESLLKQGSLVLSGYALKTETKAAIMSGDIAWIEKRCGKLSEEEREWLLRRLQIENW